MARSARSTSTSTARRSPSSGAAQSRPGDSLLINRVRSALTPVARVVEKRMFGGVTFMVRGKMCVSAGKGRIMCRIDPAIHETAVQRTGCRTVLMKGREYRGYVYVDGEAVSGEPELTFWIGLALDYNERAFGSRSKTEIELISRRLHRGGSDGRPG